LGLKENVIVGRLIPAGTGFEEYRDTFVLTPKQESSALVGDSVPVAVGQSGDGSAENKGAAG